MANISPNPSTTSTFGEAPIRVGSSFSRPAALIGGATALIALTAIATTLVVKQAAPAGDTGAEARSATIAAQSLPTTAKTSGAVGNDGDDKPQPKVAPAPAPRTATPTPAAKSAAPAARVAAVCATCGVVESVTAFKKKGEGSGIGAVGGAVVGGLLGNQVGGGDGKKAMTVIGAVGGGVAGNKIEQHQRATTLYSIKVRMEDGSVRSITQSTAPTVGQKVTVDGQQVKARA